MKTYLTIVFLLFASQLYSQIDTQPFVYQLTKKVYGPVAYWWTSNIILYPDSTFIKIDETRRFEKDIKTAHIYNIDTTTGSWVNKNKKDILLDFRDYQLDAKLTSRNLILIYKYEPFNSVVRNRYRRTK